MKFNTEKPALDSIKIKRCYAILPTRMEDGTIIWLDRYTRVLKYTEWIHIDTKETRKMWHTILNVYEKIDENIAIQLIKEKSERWINEEVEKERRKLGA